MNEPRRLNRSGGASQRLLDSASLDKPGPAARRHAAELAATTSAFATTGAVSGVVPLRRSSSVKTLATWIIVGAAASVAIGLAGSQLLGGSPDVRTAAPLLAVPPRGAAATSPDIAAEPAAAPQRPQPRPPTQAGVVQPWVPSVGGVAQEGALLGNTSRPSAVPFAEMRQIEAARAAVSRGEADAAIAQLNDYDSSHRSGQFRAESMALRIQALSISGRVTEARALASEFQEKYSEHPLLNRVRRGVSE